MRLQAVFSYLPLNAGKTERLAADSYRLTAESRISSFRISCDVPIFISIYYLGIEWAIFTRFASCLAQQTAPANSGHSHRVFLKHRCSVLSLLFMLHRKSIRYIIGTYTHRCACIFQIEFLNTNMCLYTLSSSSFFRASLSHSFYFYLLLYFKDESFARSLQSQTSAIACLLCRKNIALDDLYILDVSY